MTNGDFPQLCNKLPEGNHGISNEIWGFPGQIKPIHLSEMKQRWLGNHLKRSTGIRNRVTIGYFELLIDNWFINVQH